MKMSLFLFPARKIVKNPLERGEKGGLARKNMENPLEEAVKCDFARKNMKNPHEVISESLYLDIDSV